MAVRVSSPVLIGRARELERLDAAIEAARRGDSRIVTLAGEAGVGKTRLVSELASRADALGMTTLVGGCIDLHEGSLPYAPVVEALRGFIRHGDPDEVADVIGPTSPVEYEAWSGTRSRSRRSERGPASRRCITS